MTSRGYFFLLLTGQRKLIFSHQIRVWLTGWPFCGSPLRSLLAVWLCLAAMGKLGLGDTISPKRVGPCGWIEVCTNMTLFRKTFKFSSTVRWTQQHHQQATCFNTHLLLASNPWQAGTENFKCFPWLILKKLVLHCHVNWEKLSLLQRLTPPLYCKTGGSRDLRMLSGGDFSAFVFGIIIWMAYLGNSVKMTTAGSFHAIFTLAWTIWSWRRCTVVASHIRAYPQMCENVQGAHGVLVTKS